jgi:hypothetical protein
VSLPEVRRLLERAALDPAFRAEVRADASAALADFDLSDEERAVVERGGEALLDLLARALGGAEPPGEADAAPQTEGLAAAGPAPVLPGEGGAGAAANAGQVGFVVHVETSQVETPRGPQVAYQASVHPEGEAPPAGPQSIQLRVGLTPRQLATPQGPRLAYQTSLEPWPRPSTSAAPAAEPKGGSAHDASPWGHRLREPDVDAAVAAVRAAPSEERYAALRRLIDVVRGVDAP